MDFVVNVKDDLLNDLRRKEMIISSMNNNNNTQSPKQHQQPPPLPQQKSSSPFSQIITPQNNMNLTHERWTEIDDEDMDEDEM